jgi:hypothetical protein
VGSGLREARYDGQVADRTVVSATILTVAHGNCCQPAARNP